MELRVDLSSAVDCQRATQLLAMMLQAGGAAPTSAGAGAPTPATPAPAPSASPSVPAPVASPAPPAPAAAAPAPPPPPAPAAPAGVDHTALSNAINAFSKKYSAKAAKDALVQYGYKAVPEVPAERIAELLAYFNQ